MFLYTGYHAFLDATEVELRAREAALNPTVPPANANVPNPAPVYCQTDAPAPAAKTHQFHQEAARASDIACASGIRCSQKQHPHHQTGVLASHALQKAPGHDDEHSRKPDPMHCIGGEAFAVTTMALGGTGNPRIYSVGRLQKLAEWEVKRNKRWQRALGPYLLGESGPSLLYLVSNLCITLMWCQTM